MFSAIKNRLRGLYGKVTGTQTLEMIVGKNSNMSSEMESAISRWRKLYEDKAPWVKEPTSEDPVKVISLGLAKQIACEKARMACLEMKSEVSSIKDTKEVTDELTGLTYIDSVDKGDKSRAVYLNEQYQSVVIDKIREQLELGIALGGFVAKPYVIKNQDNSYRFAVDYSQADDFIPISFDESGNLTEAAFIEKLVTENYIYSRVEHHKYADGASIVENKAYRADNAKIPSKSKELGKEISLTAIPQWSALAPKVKIICNRPLFAYFKMPLANNIDTHSPLGISVYSGATEKLIKEADEQFSRMAWEFEAGEMAIDIDATYLHQTKDDNGNTVTKMSEKQARLYRMHDFDEQATTWNIHAPTLRDVSLINGLNEIKREIERNCALSPGTISDPNDVAKTAEEIRSGKPASISSNIDIQNSLEGMLKHIVYIMDVYTTLYNMAPNGEYEVSFEWGNGIKEDPDKEATRKMTEIDRGLATDVDYIEYQYGLTRKQAIEKVKEIQAYNAWKSGINAQKEIDDA